MKYIYKDHLLEITDGIDSISIPVRPGRGGCYVHPNNSSRGYRMAIWPEENIVTCYVDGEMVGEEYECSIRLVTHIKDLIYKHTMSKLFESVLYI